MASIFETVKSFSFLDAPFLVFGIIQIFVSVVNVHEAGTGAVFGFIVFPGFVSVTKIGNRGIGKGVIEGMLHTFRRSNVGINAADVAEVYQLSTISGVL